MINRSYPKLNLYTKKQLANAICGRGVSFNDAIALIADCLENKDKYWFDNLKESKPDDDKWVRSASRTPLGRLQKRINQQVFAAHDSELPPFIYGGVGKKGIKSAVVALQGSRNKRTLLKIDMRRFFEHISYDDVVKTLASNCSCGRSVAQVIAEMACVYVGRKSSGGAGKQVLARGFSTSSRLAVWCNLNFFNQLFMLVARKLKKHDPKIVIYMDDIGITASRVDPATMSSLYQEILNLLKNNGANLEINENKTKIVDYLQHEYNTADGSMKDGVIEPFEFLGIRMGRNCLYPGVKLCRKMSKMISKPTHSKKEQQTLKGQKRYVKYITNDRTR